MDRNNLRDNIDDVLSEMFKVHFVNRYLKFIEGEGAVLYCLAKNPEGIIPSKISEILQVSRARVTNILNTLKNKNLIELYQDSEDRRKTYIIMTEKGNNLISNLINERINLFDLLIEKLGEDKMEAFYELLTVTLATFKMIDEEGICDE